MDRYCVHDCCILSQVFIGFICNAFNINNHNQIYRFYENKVGVNVLTGFLFGFMYMLFELPNSFIKRRLDIECGKTNTNIIGKLFFVIDQIDSLIGVMLILVIFAKISWKQYFAYIFIGGFTHIMVNLFLYKIKVRRNV